MPEKYPTKLDLRGPNVSADRIKGRHESDITHFQIQRRATEKHWIIILRVKNRKLRAVIILRAEPNMTPEQPHVQPTDRGAA